MLQDATEMIMDHGHLLTDPTTDLEVASIQAEGLGAMKAAQRALMTQVMRGIEKNTDSTELCASAELELIRLRDILNILRIRSMIDSLKINTLKTRSMVIEHE